MSDIACRFCGEDGLHWEEHDYGWGLYDAHGFRHHCQTTEAKYSRVDIYEAVDAMSPHELRELVGYAEQRLLPSEGPHG